MLDCYTISLSLCLCMIVPKQRLCHPFLLLTPAQRNGWPIFVSNEFMAKVWIDASDASLLRDTEK